MAKPPDPFPITPTLSGFTLFRDGGTNQWAMVKDILVDPGATPTKLFYWFPLGVTQELDNLWTIEQTRLASALAALRQYDPALVHPGTERTQ